MPEKKLALLEVTQIAGIRDQRKSQRAKPPDDIARFLEQAHMSAAGGEDAVWLRELGDLMYRDTEFRCGVIEAPRKKMGCAYYEACSSNGDSPAELQCTSRCSMAMSGSPAQTLMMPLMCHPRAKLGLSDSA